MKAFEFSDAGDKIVIAANNKPDAREHLRSLYGGEFDHMSVREISQEEASNFEVLDEDDKGAKYKLSQLLVGRTEASEVCNNISMCH